MTACTRRAGSGARADTPSPGHKETPDEFCSLSGTVQRRRVTGPPTALASRAIQRGQSPRDRHTREHHHHDQREQTMGRARLWAILLSCVSARAFHSGKILRRRRGAVDAGRPVPCRFSIGSHRIVAPLQWRSLRFFLLTSTYRPGGGGDRGGARPQGRAHDVPALAASLPIARGADDAAGGVLEHDPEKWTPDFGKDHAPPIG